MGFQLPFPQLVVVSRIEKTGPINSYVFQCLIFDSLRFRYSLERRHLQRGVNLRATHRGPSAWQGVEGLGSPKWPKTFAGPKTFPELCTQLSSESLILVGKPHPFFILFLGEKGGYFITTVTLRHSPKSLCQIYAKYVAAFDSETPNTIHDPMDPFDADLDVHSIGP